MAAAATARRRTLRLRHASKSRRLQTRTHSEPPKTPVYSYHCTAHTSCEKPLPKTSHGHEKSPAVYQYSVVIQAATSTVEASALGARFETVWNSMKAKRLSDAETSVAATGPTGVAYPIHHTVAAFHSTKTSAAHPSMPHQPRRVAGCTDSIHSSGTRATGSVSPVPESQAGERSATESATAANLRSIRKRIYERKSSQSEPKNKPFGDENAAQGPTCAATGAKIPCAAAYRAA